MKNIKGKRYYYLTVGYAIFSKLGEGYAAGRIEIRDKESDSPYSIDEGSYWVPLELHNKFREFFDGLETDLPMFVSIGSFEQIEAKEY